MKDLQHPRANVLGVGISALDMQTAVRMSDELLQTGGKGYICVTGVHGVMEAQRNPSFRAVQNGSFLTTPDGMPTVWVGRLQGHRTMRRVYGPDFMVELCKYGIDKGYRHFLYGGEEGVAEQLKHTLVQRCPGLKIVGTYTPPFRELTPEEEADLDRQVRESSADILWCGLSTPKQERFIAGHIQRSSVKLMVGVGAAFDINSGRTQDAPDWMKSIGMQWLHRLLHEPARLWRRYLYNNPQFLWLLLLQFMGVRRYQNQV